MRTFGAVFGAVLALWACVCMMLAAGAFFADESTPGLVLLFNAAIGLKCSHWILRATD